MYAIICGLDAFGRKLLTGLLKKGHDVVAIEENREIANEVQASTNGVIVNGDATSVIVLEQAGIAKANVFIANALTDAMNLALCVIAKKYGVEYVIANVRDPAYLDAFKIIGVDKRLAAVDTLYEELINVIETPAIEKSMPLDGYKLLVVDVGEDDKIAGKRVSELEEKIKGLHVLALLTGDSLSRNKQAKIAANTMLVLLVEKDREERVRKLFKK